MKKTDVEKWTEEYREFIAKNPERKERFETRSGIPLKPIYTSADLEGFDEERDLGFPGQYPYTRGVYPSMYRGRYWTRRVSAGLQMAEEFNKRQRELFEQGATGVTFDTCYVTLRGYDSDMVPKELVGRCGTPIDSLQDFEIAFSGIPLDKVTNSITDPGPFCLPAMHFALAEKQGVPFHKLMGTSNQSDFLNHYISGHGYLRFGLEGHLRVLMDHVKFCTRQVPKWHPLSTIGHHMAEGGATGVQELAFLLSSGIFYVGELLKQGLEVDEFAPRLSLFPGTSGEFFEDIAKLRAARRMWAKILRERFHAKDPRSWQGRIYCAGVAAAYAAQQPLNNIVRVCLNNLAGALAGVQAMHSASYDEAWWIPTEKAHRVAIMTQNIIAEETGISDVIDPLGGSYYVEYLTNELERRAWEYIEKIDDMGGMFEATKNGYPQKEIARAALKFKKEIDSGERVWVGVNRYVVPEEELPMEQEGVTPELIDRQIERTKRLKRERDQKRASEGLKHLGQVARGGDGNLFEAVMEALKANCTCGEIIRELREVYGAGTPLDVMSVIP